MCSRPTHVKQISRWKMSLEDFLTVQQVSIINWTQPRWPHQKSHVRDLTSMLTSVLAPGIYIDIIARLRKLILTVLPPLPPLPPLHRKQFSLKSFFLNVLFCRSSSRYSIVSIDTLSHLSMFLLAHLLLLPAHRKYIYIYLFISFENLWKIRIIVSKFKIYLGLPQVPPLRHPALVLAAAGIMII